MLGYGHPGLGASCRVGSGIRDGEGGRRGTASSGVVKGVRLRTAEAAPRKQAWGDWSRRSQWRILAVAGLPRRELVGNGTTAGSFFVVAGDGPGSHPSGGRGYEFQVTLPTSSLFEDIPLSMASWPLVLQPCGAHLTPQKQC